MDARADGTPGIVAEHVAPLQTVTFSGQRYVASADLGLTRPVPLMVHGNGRVFLSVVHAVAGQLSGRPIAKVEEYGYTARGMGLVDVPTMRLAGAVFEDIRDVPVFDFSDALDDPVQGMLGTHFLTAARAAVDFRTDSLLLGVGRSDPANPARIADGYRDIPMGVAADGRVTIDVRFPAIDRVIPITPSTVANSLTLHAPLFAGKLDLRRSTQDRSPSGTSPDVFTSDDVAFEIAGVALRAEASFQGLAEYEQVTEEELGSYGMLGFDWMRAHEAVIDYANLILSFRP